MCQTFVLLLRTGPQNKARLKPVGSAKKFADPWSAAIDLLGDSYKMMQFTLPAVWKGKLEF